MADWAGDNPMFLVIRKYDAGPDSTVIDLDEGGWATKYADLMRAAGVWMLCSKEASEKMGVLMPVLMVQVKEGDQPFYTTRHVNIQSFGDDEGPKSKSYGIGRKNTDGTVESVFILPNGSIAVGSDVYWLADRMNKGQL